jgi:hypothetical protein
MQNTSSQNQPVSSLVQWALKDSTGQKFNEDIFFGGGPDGTLQKAGSNEGTLRYEVPKSVHSFTLQFVPGIGSTDLAVWNITD